MKEVNILVNVIRAFNLPVRDGKLFGRPTTMNPGNNLADVSSTSISFGQENSALQVQAISSNHDCNCSVLRMDFIKAIVVDSS